MPKTTDIEGTFRIPEEAWGRFWNTMLSIPGAAITPTTRAQAPSAKRSNGKVSDGSTGKCLVLRHLNVVPKAPLSELSELLVKNGKSKTSVANVVFELKKAKRIKGDAAGYSITPAGRAFVKANCNDKAG